MRRKEGEMAKINCEGERNEEKNWRGGKLHTTVHVEVICAYSVSHPLTDLLTTHPR